MERALPNAFPPGRSSGLGLQGHALEERISWGIGGFMGTDDFGSGNSGSNAYSVTGRVTGRPWYEEEGERLLHLGIAYSYRNIKSDPVGFDSRPEAHLAPKFADTGDIAADRASLIGGEAALVLGPASFQAEYIVASVDATTQSDPDFYGFYVQASYFLTGEHRPFEGDVAEFGRIKPKRNFLDEGGGLGAWEIGLRYSAIDLQDEAIAGDKVKDITAGLNWYLNPNMRVMFNYVHSAPESSGDADLFQFRFQVDF
jgi:phosphate-selective porin OprO/OprP